MSDTQSKIDSLRELNDKLLAEISELRRENAEVKAENTKLKQAIEANAELKTRFEELEKKNKTDTSNLIAENAELRDRVTKLEQKQTQSDSVHVLEDSILHEASSDISSNIHTYSSEPKSLENKEIDEFLDLKSKERVSSEIK